MKALITCLSLALSFAVAAQGGAPPPASVSVDTATEESMSSVFVAPGTVVSRNNSRISAEVVGRLIWVAEIGAQVAAGETLASIDDRVFQLRLRANDATIRRLEANSEYLGSQLVRYERLVQQSSVTRDQVEELRAQIEMAKQEVVNARVQREQTVHDINQTKIKAPFDGRVIERQASVGEYISVGGEVLRFVDTTNIEIRAQAPVSVARYLRAKMPVRVRDDRGSTDSVIHSIVGVSDERSRMVEVRIALNEPDWIIGSAVRVELPQGEPSLVVAVSRDALVLRHNATFLYKVNPDNTVEQIPVRTGIGNGARIEVEGDISNGDRVVIRGGERLRPGQSVVIIQTS